MNKICIDISEYRRQDGTIVSGHKRCYNRDKLSEADIQKIKEFNKKAENIAKAKAELSKAKEPLMAAEPSSKRTFSDRVWTRGSMEDKLWQDWGGYQAKKEEMTSSIRKIAEIGWGKDVDLEKRYDTLRMEVRDIEEAFEGAISAGWLSPKTEKIPEILRDGPLVGGKWVEAGGLNLYHATVNLEGIRKHGLLTKGELNANGFFEGLGGGSGISTTTDKDYAELLADTFQEIKVGLNGTPMIRERFLALKEKVGKDKAEEFIRQVAVNTFGHEDIIRKAILDNNPSPTYKSGFNQEEKTYSAGKFLGQFYNVYTMYDPDKEWIALSMYNTENFKDADINVVSLISRPGSHATFHPGEREYRYYSGAALQTEGPTQSLEEWCTRVEAYTKEDGTKVSAHRRCFDRKTGKEKILSGSIVANPEMVYNKYGIDPNAGLKTNLESFEDAINNQDFETIAVFTEDGSLKFVQEGEKNYVKLSDDEIKMLEGATISHNHPSWKKWGKGRGQSLSIADVALTIHGKAKRVRAVSGSVVYEMEFDEDYWEFSGKSSRSDYYLRVIKNKSGYILETSLDQRTWTQESIPSRDAGRVLHDIVDGANKEVQNIFGPLVRKDEMSVADANIAHWDKVWKLFIKNNVKSGIKYYIKKNPRWKD